MSQVKVDEHRTEEGGVVAVVTLNDPERRNALTLEMVSEIAEAFDGFESEGSEVGAVIVTGAGKAFCAGADLARLSEHGKGDDDARERGLRSIYEGFLRVARSSLPTLAAVNGPAVGAGMNLALCCDVRIAGQAARFDTRFLQIGMHPGGGHMWMLQRAVGPQVASAMVLFGAVLGSDEALRHGLVLELVDDDQLLDHARTLAGKASSSPRELARRAKRELMLPADLHAQAIDREIGAQVWSLGQPFFGQRLTQLQSKIAGKG